MSEDLHTPLMGMQTLHSVLGTEPANRLPAPLALAAEQYLRELDHLQDAIEGERAAIAAGSVPTYRLTAARLRMVDAMRCYREERVRAQIQQHRASGALPVEEIQ